MAQRAAQRIGLGAEVGEQLFLAGVLHDVGRLLFAGMPGGGPTRHLEASPADERAATGSDHAQVSARMAAGWGIPAAVVSLVRRHHDLASDDDPALTLLFLADEVVHASVLGAPRPRVVIAPLLRPFGLPATGFDALAESLWSEVGDSLRAMEAIA